MAEFKGRVCDYAIDALPGQRCRTLADDNCVMCSGDFCNEHITSETILFKVSLRREREHATHLSHNIIKLCPRCAALVSQSFKERDAPPSSATIASRFKEERKEGAWNEINAAIAEATEKISTILKAIWAEKALTKESGDG